jgi:hypothetical protein
MSDSSITTENAGPKSRDLEILAIFPEAFTQDDLHKLDSFCAILSQSKIRYSAASDLATARNRVELPCRKCESEKGLVRSIRCFTPWRKMVPI